MASEHASGVDQDQDVVRLLSSLECDMAVQSGVLKQYGKLQDAVKAFLVEKVKNTHEKQEVERLLEELTNKNKDLTLKMETLQSMNYQLSMKNKDLTLKLKEKLVETESLKRSILSDRTQGVLTRSMCTQKVQECVKRVTADDELKEESFDHALTNRIIAEDCERRRELSEIRKKLIEVFGDIDHHRQIIGIKMMGQINSKPFLDAACGGHGHPSNRAKVAAAKNCSAWQQMIQDPAWHPYKRITEEGPTEEVLNDDDETLKKLKACGEEIYDAVIEALKEMDEYNKSGRTSVPELWNYREGKKATVMECIEYLGKIAKEVICKKRKKNQSST